VRAIAFSAIVPVSAIDVVRTGVCDDNNDDDVLRSNNDHHECRNAAGTVAWVALSCVLMWASYLKGSNAISFVGFAVTVGLCTFMDLNQWPYSGESLVTTIFPSIIIGNFFNESLTVPNHMVRMAVLFGAAAFVADRSPYADFAEDVVPGLGVPIAIAIAVLTVTRIETKGKVHRLALSSSWWSSSWSAALSSSFFVVVDAKRWTVQGSRCLLAAIYLHHAASGLLSATEAGASVRAVDVFAAVAKATLVALVGIAANGTFEREIETNDRLEELVRERTKTIRAKSERLSMVELALRCSETAIAIADSDRRMIWANAACEALALPRPPKRESRVDGDDDDRRPNHHLLGRPIVEAIALETIVDEKKLRRVFSAVDDEEGGRGGGGGKRTTEEETVGIDGKIFRLEVSPCGVGGLGGGSNGGRYLVVLKNITADLAREVAEKTAREEAMLVKAMSDSMVTLTHELRTPMQGIMGVTGMLLQQKESAKDAVLAESLKLIMASSGLLLNLINNLLDVKKVNSEMMDEFPLSAVNAASSIRDTIDFCQPLASISGVAVVTEFGDDDDDEGHRPRTTPRREHEVVSNSLRLQQILINLVSNAIKYTAERSDIRIKIEPTVLGDVEARMDRALATSRETITASERPPENTPVLCFSIRDSGPGIAPHQADRLFRRFARLDVQPTRVLGGSSGGGGQPSGTGLGLHLCQLFVQRMRGEIWATNNEGDGGGGRGSTFSFYLPLVIPDAAELAALSSSSALAAAAAVDKPPKKLSSMKRSRSFQDLELSTAQLRVLLVDDVLINRKVIGRMIRQVGVDDVVVADSGRVALDLLDASNSCCRSEDSESSFGSYDEQEEIPFDLVITDLQMPGMSGTELCEAILGGSDRHRGAAAARLPVVVGLTADTSPEVAVRCRASGMSELLHKPISIVELRDFFESTAPRLRPGAWRDVVEGVVVDEIVPLRSRRRGSAAEGRLVSVAAAATESKRRTSRAAAAASEGGPAQ